MRTFLSGLIFLMAFGVVQNSYADGTESYGGSYTYGIYRFTVKNCLQEVYVNASKYEIHAVVASDFNYDDPQSAVFQIYTAGGFEEVSESPVPTNFKTQGQEVKVKKTSTGEVYTWKIYVRKAIKASLPFNRNFTSLSPVSAYDPNDANSIGWAYRVVNYASTPSAPILSSKDQALFLAYDGDATEFSCLFYGSNNNVQTNLKGNIDASADGVTWTTLKAYSNDVPANNALAEDKKITLPLNGSYKYIRLIMNENKGATDPNITINQLSILNTIGTSIDSEVQTESKIYVAGNKIVLDDLDVMFALLLNISGQIVGKSSSPEIDINGLNKGIYIVAATLKNGESVYKKVMLP